MISTVLKMKYIKMTSHTVAVKYLMVRGTADGIYIKFKLIYPCVARAVYNYLMCCRDCI